MMVQKRIACAAVAVALSWVSAAVAQEKELSMGGATTASAMYPYFTSVANSVSKNSDKLAIKLLENSGYAINIEQLAAGKLHLGAVSPDLVEVEQAKGNSKFRVLWYVTPLIQNTMVAKSAGITDMSQFDGKCLNPGPKGSSTEKVMINILKTLNIKPELMAATPDEIKAAIGEGRCLGQTRSQPTPKLDAATAELNLSTPLVPVGWNPEQQAKIKAAMPVLALVDIPAGVVPGAPAYVTHATWALIASTSDVDADTAYEVVKSMATGYRLQQLALQALRETPLTDLLQRTLDSATFPLHAGAVRYYREAGLNVPDKLVPPEMK